MKSTYQTNYVRLNVLFNLANFNIIKTRDYIYIYTYYLIRYLQSGDRFSPVYHCIRMRTHAVQYKQFNVVSSVKCFILAFKTWKKFAVHEDNREHKVFYINMVWNFSSFFISMGLIFSSTAHICWNGSRHKNTIHLLHDDEGHRNEDWFSKK